MQFIAMRFVAGDTLQGVIRDQRHADAAAVGGVRLPGGLRPGRRARRRPGPPGRQAGQHPGRLPARRPGAPVPDRLRHRPGDAVRGQPDRRRPVPRHPRLRRPRAGQRPAGRRPGRPVRARLRRLRDAQRHGPVQARLPVGALRAPVEPPPRPPRPGRTCRPPSTPSSPGPWPRTPTSATRPAPTSPTRCARPSASTPTTRPARRAAHPDAADDRLRAPRPRSVQASRVPGTSRTVPAPPVTWTAVVTVDRDYYDRIQAVNDDDTQSISFPGDLPERRIPLPGPEVLIGRYSSPGASTRKSTWAATQATRASPASTPSWSPPPTAPGPSST